MSPGCLQLSLSSVVSPSCWLSVLSVLAQAPHPQELGYYSPPKKIPWGNLGDSRDLARLWHGGCFGQGLWRGSHLAMRLRCGGHDMGRLWLGRYWRIVAFLLCNSQCTMNQTTAEHDQYIVPETNESYPLVVLSEWVRLNPLETCRSTPHY